MLTSFLTVRRHSCRSIPRSTNPLPHYPLFSSYISHNFTQFHTMYWGHELLAAPLESIRCALFPPRRGCVPCTHHFRSPPLLRRANPCAHTLLRAPAQ